jgi:hypothetical protein
MGSVVGDIFGGGREAAFGKEKRALEEAERQARAATAAGVGFEQPFMGAGRTGLERLLGEISGDPTQTILQAQRGFAQSPAQKFQQQQALEAIRNAQAATGMAGSGLQQQQLAQAVANITGQQQEQFMRDVLGARQQDIGALLGTGQIGGQAARTAAGGEFGLGQQLAGLTGQIGQAEAGQELSRAGGLSQLLGSIFGGVGTGIRAGMGGGGLAGGLGAGLGSFLGMI